MPLPLPLRAYRLLSPLFALPAYRRSTARMLDEHVPPERCRERAGHATLPRPDGTLLWCHAASVGESLSLLPLLDTLSRARPSLQVLVTTGTPASARALRSRLPAHVRHQFAPLDSARSMRRFLRHWRPQAALLVESELWPNLILETDAAGIPLALVNAQLSPGSLRRWSRAGDSLCHLLAPFAAILTADADTRDGLLRLGLDPARLGPMPSLKSLAPAAPPPEVPPDIRTALGDRPVWLAASTHPGEEPVLLAAHRALRATHPELCLILAPRQPQRGDVVAAMLRDHDLPPGRRSAGDLPDGPVYLVDRIGEMPLWYGCARFAFVGGSLVPSGGHNPFEALDAGIPVLAGPQTGRFADTYATLTGAGAAVTVTGTDSLIAAAQLWLDDPHRLQEATARARGIARADPAALSEISNRLLRALGL